MKQINEQVARIRKMMGLNENVNEFFSMTGEREGLPEPVDEELTNIDELSPELRKKAHDFANYDYTSGKVKQDKQSLHKKRGVQSDAFNTHVDPELQKEADAVANLFTQVGRGEFKATVNPNMSKGFVDVYIHPISGYSPNNTTNTQIRITVTKDTDKISTEIPIVPQNVQRRIGRLVDLIQTKHLPQEKSMDEVDLTGKQKNLAALAEPKDKITGADLTALRHGSKLEETETNKYAKLEAAIEKEGSRKVAVRLVDAVLMKMTGMFTSSDLPDTATYANGLDTIEELLDVQDYKAAYEQAKETASDMLEEEGYSDFLGEKELSNKQKDIAAQAPPYNKISGADFKAMGDKNEVDESSIFPFSDQEHDQFGGRFPKYNRNLINSYVEAIEKRYRMKKMGVTPDELFQRFNEMDELPSRFDIEMIMRTLSNKGLLFTDTTYKNVIPVNRIDHYLNYTNPNKFTDTEQLAADALDTSMNETVTITKENMFNALSEAKKSGKVNPWAVCTSSVGRDNKNKYERCVKNVKSQNKQK